MRTTRRFFHGFGWRRRRRRILSFFSVLKDTNECQEKEAQRINYNSEWDVFCGGGGGDKKTMRIQGICVGNQTLKIMKNNEKSERASESI